MAARDEPKIDCHNHILDPERFPYNPASPYKPGGQEVAPVEQLLRVMDAHGVTHALVVGPNSGYAEDNRCLLDGIARGAGRLKGIAVVPLDVGERELARLQAAGIVGVAFNPSLYGVGRYAEPAALLDRLATLGLFLQLQVENDQLPEMLGCIGRSPVRLLIDHCGRPDVAAGLHSPGFSALVELGRSGSACVKLSGFYKFSREAFPYSDVVPFVAALVEAFTLERCVWGSDWPFLRATVRLDYGPLVSMIDLLFPDPGDRRALLSATPSRLFRFECDTKVC